MSIQFKVYSKLRLADPLEDSVPIAVVIPPIYHVVTGSALVVFPCFLSSVINVHKSVFCLIL